MLGRGMVYVGGPLTAEQEVGTGYAREGLSMVVSTV